MNRNQIDMTPVLRDEKALRRTAWWLVAFIIIGGVMILLAYQKKMKQDEKDDRPAIVGNIVKAVRGTLKVKRQDGNDHELSDLKGKVLCLQAISVEDAERGTESLRAMQAAAKTFSNNSQVTFVSIIINPGEVTTALQTAQNVATHIGADVKQWWVGIADPKFSAQYLKDVCKLADTPHIENGKLVYDTSIILVDAELNIRRPVVPQARGGQAYVARLDFDEAAAWDAKGIKTGTEKNNLQEMNLLFEKTIHKLLAEKNHSP